MSHVEQELLTILEHLSLPQVFSGVCVARCLVFCAMLCRSLFVLLSFFFCAVCLSSIYASDYPIWYLQTFLINVQSTLYFAIPLWWGVLDTTFCDKICQCLATGRWFSPGTLVSTRINWPPRYDWNVVESGVKHHIPTFPL